MKKKKYITPECEVVEMELVTMVSASFDEVVGGETDENDSSDQGGNRHRGEWGNLWSEFK